MKTYSMVLILAVSSLIIGCSSMDPFPAKVLYEVVPSQDICAQYEVIKEKPLTVKWIKDMRLAECPTSVVGFEASDAATVMDWIRSIQSNRGRR